MTEAAYKKSDRPLIISGGELTFKAAIEIKFDSSIKKKNYFKPLKILKQYLRSVTQEKNFEQKYFWLLFWG